MTTFADPMRPELHRVQRRRKDTHDTFSLELEAPHGVETPWSFAAGQFNMLYVFGVGEVPISISGDPTQPQTLVQVMMRFTVAALLKRDLAADQMFVSMERNMKCAIGFCGHCQFGPSFICKDGPVMRYDQVAPWFGIREF
jgi:NAD(P)H-flavin reductase